MMQLLNQSTNLIRNTFTKGRWSQQNITLDFAYKQMPEFTNHKSNINNRVFFLKSVFDGCN